MLHLSLVLVIWVYVFSRRKFDLLTILLVTWGSVLTAILLPIISYEDMTVEALIPIAISLLMFWLGFVLIGFVERPAFSSPRKRHLSLVTVLQKHFLLLSLLSVVKSLVVLYLQFRSPLFIMRAGQGISVLRSLPRSRLIEYLIDLSFVDLILSGIGGTLWSKGYGASAFIPLVNLLVISVSMGGRTYFAWGASTFLLGAIFGRYISASSKNAWPRLAVLSGLLMIGSEMTRYLRNEFAPYSWAIERIAPSATVRVNTTSLLGGFLLVSFVYVTAPILAFNHYALSISVQDIHLMGWLLKGFVNVYGLEIMRPFTQVPVSVNVYTWLPYFYEDLGYAGFAAFPLLIGALSGWSWTGLVKLRSVKYLVLVALLGTLLFFSVFDYALNNKAFFWAILVTLLF